MSRRADPEQFSSNGGLARYFVEHRQVGWMALFAILIWGAVSYRLLPQQEDPTLPPRIARVVCAMPGATAATMEESVTVALEKKIKELESIEEMSSETRANVVVISLGQRPDDPAKVDQEWDKLRAKLAEVDLPAGCLRPELHTDFGDVVTLLIALTSSNARDYRALQAGADKLEDELLQLGSVGRVRKMGAVGEEVRLRFSPTKAAEHGVALTRVVEALKQHDQRVLGGFFESESGRMPVQVSGDFHDENELLGAIVGMTKQGLPVRLGDVLESERGDEEPLPFHVDVLHRTGDEKTLARERSILLGIEMKSGQAIAHFSEEVRSAIDRVRPRLPADLELITISDQPQSVHHRIGHFTRCFGEAVLVVIFVALLLMDWRAALIVALAIPLTIAMTLGGMQIAGIPLHQISIAALIISLGMLVDDPVVATDGINRELAHGAPRGIAAWLGPFKLRRPILFATIINIFAFLPLVLLPGDKKYFIHALPVVVTLALVASRIVSMTFIPLLGYYLLRGQRGFDQESQIRRGFPFSLVDRAFVPFLPAYRRIMQTALQWPWISILVAYALLGASLVLVPRIGRQFFPPAERNQLLVDITLPETATVAHTEKTCGEVARLLQAHEEIESAALFIGGSAPRFYYNVTPRQNSDNVAQVLINTRRAKDTPLLVRRLREELDREISGARCVVKQLEQGPPIDTPIQVRLTGDDLDVLRQQADEVAEVLRSAGGYHVHDDLGTRAPALELAIDPERATKLGVSGSATGALVRAAFAGIKVAELRGQGSTTPVRLIIPMEERDSIEKVSELGAESASGGLVPLSAFMKIQQDREYAAIPHFGQRRSVTVKSYAAFGELPAEVLARAKPEIDRIALPQGYRMEYAGEIKELKQSRDEMSRIMFISLALITLAMIVQFNSVVKSVAVMLTVPLGLIGALIGLTVFHAPLGFMAMLALVSLAGVIVSHIIVLSDAVEDARAHKVELKEALVQAGLIRMRPVLVTVFATAGGLIPLATTGGELWRPLTAVHIFGLLVATTLTLFALPVIYYLFERRKAPESRQ